MSNKTDNVSSEENNIEETKSNDAIDSNETKTETVEKKAKDDSPTGCCGSCS